MGWEASFSDLTSSALTVVIATFSLRAAIEPRRDVMAELSAGRADEMETEGL